MNNIWFCAQNSDEWLPAVNNVRLCDSGQWQVAECCAQCMIMWLRTLTSGYLLWTRHDSVLRTAMSGCLLWIIYDYVIQDSDEWLNVVSNVWLCDLWQWPVAACEQDMILWIRTVMSGCLLWIIYDYVNHYTDEWLASVNRLWFFEFNKNTEPIESLVFLSFSKMIARNYVGSRGL